MILGIASFAIAFRTHGEGGEGSALAAIGFRVSRKGRDIASKVENIDVVLAKAKFFFFGIFDCMKYLFLRFMRDNDMR